MALTVVGVFDDAQEAQKAVNDLVSEGFSRDSIDLSAQTGTHTNDSYSAGTAGKTDDVVPDRHRNTSGTMSEEVVDDTKDVGDSIGDFFRSLFGTDDDDDYRRHTSVAQRGSVVTVHAMSEDQAEKAADILDDNGAVNVNDRAEQYGYAGSGTMGAATGVTGMAATDMDLTNRDLTDRSTTDQIDNDQTIKVIKEDLQVGKREVEQGGVRVRSRIVERPVEESVRLREERVTVQRNPVNRPATDADLNAFTEGDITMTERSEVPVVSKTANVIEEISVGKEVSERTETVRDTVRETDVDVENLGPTDDRRDRNTTDRDGGILL